MCYAKNRAFGGSAAQLLELDWNTPVTRATACSGFELRVVIEK
jgi:hypothetical protein